MPLKILVSHSSLALTSNSHICCWSATDGTAGSSRTAGGPDRQFWETISLQLRKTLKDLWSQLHDWCAAPQGHTDTEPPRPDQFPNSHTRWTSSTDILPRGPYEATWTRCVLEFSFIFWTHTYLQSSKGYIPDYNVPEEEVANEALLLALALSRTLSHTKSCETIIVVADQLRNLGGMLRDIGMPKDVLQAVSVGRLEVAEITAGAFGDEEWVLHDLWRCAADYVWELDIYADGREAAATKAANAARQLIFISSKHINFYRACHLHYDAIARDMYCLDEEAQDKIDQALKLFREAVSSTSLSAHVEEMIRAWRTHSRFADFDSETMQAIHDQILLHPSNPTWAVLCAEIGDNINLEQLDDDSLEKVLCLETHAINVLKSFQDVRPTRIQCLLACAFETRGECLAASDRLSEAIQDFEDAIRVQAMVASSGQEDDIDTLFGFVQRCVQRQLYLQRWEDALDTFKRSVNIVGSHSRAETRMLSAGLSAFQVQLEISRDVMALSATRTLIGTLRPLLGSNHPEDVLYGLVNILVSISDIQREIGEFHAALDASREALAVERELRSRDSKYIYASINALACQARSLIDDGVYEDATALLQEAISLWRTSSCDLARHLGMFGVVHAHAVLSGRPSCIDEVVSASGADPGNCARPCWLYPIVISGDDMHAWLLLIRSVMECTTSPAKALTSAKESLNGMSQYYVRNRVEMKPHVKASVFGHQYILFSILGDRGHGQSVLNESIAHFRTVLDNDPRMARLPLIVFLDILFVLFRPLPLRFEMSALQRWKKSVYQGSTSFFEDFVAFLEGLPHYIHGKS